MKLHELHVHQFSACVISQGHAVAGVFPRIRSDAPGLADAAGAYDNRLCPEDDEAARLSPVAERPSHPLAVFQQTGNRALHVNVDA